jgi:hypothetical protein
MMTSPRNLKTAAMVKKTMATTCTVGAATAMATTTTNVLEPGTTVTTETNAIATEMKATIEMTLTHSFCISAFSFSVCSH